IGVSVERLALEGDEHRTPGTIGKLNEESTVLEGAVVALKWTIGIALIHVNVMDPLVRIELEERIGAVRAVTESLAEGVDRRVLLDRLLDQRVDRAVQGRGAVCFIDGQQAHLCTSDQTRCANEIQGQVVAAV